MLHENPATSETPTAHTEPAERGTTTATSLVQATSVSDVVRTIAERAGEVQHLRISAYTIQDGICILTASHGPIDTSVVSRAVASAETVTDKGVLAVPVTVGDEPVAVLSSSARVAGEDAQPCLEFLADVAAIGVGHLTATRLAQDAGVLVAGAPAGLTGSSHTTPFRALLDSATMWLGVLDVHGNVVYMNPYSVQMMGINPDDYLGQSFTKLPVRDGLGPFSEQLLAADENLRAGKSVSDEVDVRCADGSVRLLSCQLSPVVEPGGELAHILVTGVDVTEQREAEQSLRRTNDALEQARAEAEKSAAARSDFLASMSHEIRTPLNAIIGTTTLLLDNHQVAVTGEHAEILRTSAEHLLAIINDILDISKLETDKVEIDDDRFAVDALVESALDLVMGSAGAKGVEVTSIVESGTPEYLYGDAPRVRQVLVNLLSNAVKYTDEGVVELVCRGHYVGVERVELVLDVRDTGPGIPSDELDSLFDPFVQAESQRVRVEGTGLGLSISERLVRMMGGTITVRSTVGVGTTFTVTIPFEVDTAAHPPSPLSEPKDLAGLTVLVVDDIEINRRVLELETKRWGMVPTLCASPLDALALVEGGRRFDLALLDLNMPDMNGDELASALRHRNPCPMVLLSSTDDDLLRPDLFSARLHKPIKRHQLADAIEDALGRPPPRQVESAPVRPAGSSDPLEVLVAEDNAVNQKVVRALLSRLGYSAEIVSDGLEVIKALEAASYHLVLLDLRMPGIDGLEAAVEIIRRFGDRRPRLVAVTASATEEDRRRCLEVGMDDFVTKPVTLDGLERVLADAEAARAHAH